MLPQAYNIGIVHGFSAPVHSRDMVGGPNATEKDFSFN